MIYKYFDLSKQGKYKLISGVVVYPLKVNRDSRGILVEIMKKNWKKIFNSQNMPFAQTYYSITKTGTARDEHLWHYHPGGQQDRFGVIQGRIVVAVFDWRKNSKTKGMLNLFHIGQLPQNKGQYLVLVPKRCLHGFVVVSQKPAILFNFPTRLYDPKEEKRIPINKVQLTNKSSFSWDKVRKDFKITLK